MEPDLTHDQIDALAHGAQHPRVLVVAQWAWFEIWRPDAPQKRRADLSRLNVWTTDPTGINSPDEIEGIKAP